MQVDREALNIASRFIDRFGGRSRPVIGRMIAQSFDDGLTTTAAYLTVVELAMIVLEEQPRNRRGSGA